MSGRSDKANRAAKTSFPRFFTKQLLAFLLLAFAVVVVDFFLYAAIAYSESENNFNDGTPIATVRAVDAGLAQEDGAYALSPEAADVLAEQEAWALLVDGSGAAVWEHDVPADVPRSLTPADAAMAAHYGTVADRPAFFWDRDDGLLVVGFPKGAYWHMSMDLPESTIRNLPLYVLLMFAVDLAIFFVAYFVSRRRTQRAVAPILGALDDLSEGRPSTLRLKGDLRDVGERITEASALIEQKDAARANWIRGVSHDIRTPLSMILGYADAVAQDGQAPDGVRAQAAVIRTQGLRIADLVTDLNTASRLDYDMQPLDLERIHLARTLRSVVAAHANDGLDEAHPLELEVDESAADAVVLGDERLVTRAVENALANARLHNEDGCNVVVRLSVRQGKPSGGGRGAGATAGDPAGFAVIRVTDDGAGVSREGLAALEARLARSRTAASASGCAVGSPGSTATAEHGLGLVLVDRIARAHGGCIALDGAPGEGFSVEVVLPLA